MATDKQKRARNKPFADRLKAAVARTGKTPAEFAEACNLPGVPGYQQTLHWLSGERAPGLHSLTTIIKQLPEENVRQLICGAAE
tara:strand:+ start:1791 stop:2042 length:252 start_codon:yes stop_codon:yes gene_type:complete